MTRGSAADGGRRAFGGAFGRSAAGLAALALALAGCDRGVAPGQPPAAAPAAARPAETSLISVLGTGGSAPSLAEGDRRQVRAAAVRAYGGPEGRPVHWQNPRSGAFGEIVPLGGVRRQGERVCRDFRHVVMVAGRSFEGRGPACSRPAGGEHRG